MPEHWLCQYQTQDDIGASHAAPYRAFDTEAEALAFAHSQEPRRSVVFPIGVPA